MSFGKPWTKEEYDAYLNRKNRAADPRPDVERGDEAQSGKEDEAEKAYALYSGCCFIRFTHYRKRLADYDNLCGKYIQDSIVTNRIIHDDNPSIVSRSPEHLQVKL